MKLGTKAQAGTNQQSTVHLQHKKSQVKKPDIGQQSVLKIRLKNGLVDHRDILRIKQYNKSFHSPYSNISTYPW